MTSRFVKIIVVALALSIQCSLAQTGKNYNGFLSEFWGKNIDSTASIAFEGMKQDMSSLLDMSLNYQSQVGNDRGLKNPDIYYKRAARQYKFSGLDSKVELSLIGANFYGPNFLAPDSETYQFYKWEISQNLSCSEFEYFIKSFSEKYGDFQKKVYKPNGTRENLVRLTKNLGEVEILIGFPEFNKKDIETNDSKCICSGMCNSRDLPYKPYGVSVTNKRIIDSLSSINSKLEQIKKDSTRRSGSEL
jgi:hypothetical protein